jgi:hypothetical protein
VTGGDTDWSGAGETLVGSETEREEGEKGKGKEKGATDLLGLEGRRDKLGYTFRECGSDFIS